MYYRGNLLPVRAPEVILGLPYDQKLDLWLGILSHLHVVDMADIFMLVDGLEMFGTCFMFPETAKNFIIPIDELIFFSGVVIPAMMFFRLC